MKIFKLLLDGFKGKPDLSEMSIGIFRVDDYLIKFEFPKDILEKRHYEDSFLLEDFNIKSTEYIHQKYVNLF
ncbi:Mg-dependent DNase, partial [Vibrio harveyi]